MPSSKVSKYAKSTKYYPRLSQNEKNRIQRQFSEWLGSAKTLRESALGAFVNFMVDALQGKGMLPHEAAAKEEKFRSHLCAIDKLEDDVLDLKRRCDAAERRSEMRRQAGTTRSKSGSRSNERLRDERYAPVTVVRRHSQKLSPIFEEKSPKSPKTPSRPPLLGFKGPGINEEMFNSNIKFAEKRKAEQNDDDKGDDGASDIKGDIRKRHKHQDH